LDDRLDRARDAGDGPRAPAFVAFGAVSLGVLGAAGAFALSPWRALAEAGFSLDSRVYALLAPTLLPTVAGAAVGAVAGVVLTHLLLDRFQPALRLRVHRDRPRSTGLAALVALVLAAVALPGLLALPGGQDPGRLLIAAPLAVLGVALVLALPVALIDRARGRLRWRERVAPDPAPRRGPGEAPPEVRAALVALGRQGDVLGDCVLISGPYAVAVLLDPPRVAAHGGAALARAHAEAGRPVLQAPDLALALAAVPTGDPLPPGLAARVQALSPPG
jgi:hypothetical protein